jgi:hypothetical protein
LSDFLKRCFLGYELAICSTSKADNIRWVIKSTIMLRNYKYVFVNTRRNCKRILGKHGCIEYHKDITPFLSQYENVIVLDDFPKLVNPTECCLKAA